MTVEKKEDIKNEFIEPENYYAGYQKNIDKLKDDPAIVDLEKLCHLALTTPDGKHLMQELEKRYIIPALCAPTSPNFHEMLIYTEGFKEAFRMLKNCIRSHDQRIKAETK
jgi:hypothetical protein